MTERPKVNDDMRLAAAVLIAEQLVQAGHVEASELEQHAADLAQYGRDSSDGYELAKDLENRAYWDCNLDMATILDGYSSALRSEVENAQKTWAGENNIQPPLLIGTRVSIRGFDGELQGTIDGVYAHGPAKFTVKLDGETGSCRRIINFEDAKVLETAP
ncbi:hypothetical protein CU102_12410 [Phyllobacterium brassicacearum]|uniref:Uncharacterized protein n=1 Tax=Phyllobacterium brassicacearum TaxID=314235 RepID=A0A2P7BQ26_9HYPH|nr:hypothetical protein [Phyllobacterium brassicacearum]PSH68560.1 hypothetical protein CU102_12410 [Phyllobacterium brassicacearum]TDQ19910.1 hypothetical protein DEV91_124105 [Phyllobacterium brassicacearum]